MRIEEIQDAAELAAIPDIKQRQLAFLNRTVSFYSNNPRALGQNSMGNNVCFYSPVNGSPGCAIGRFIPDESNFDKKIISSIDDCFRMGFDIPKWMLEMGIDFLMEVQALHDLDCYWKADGPSHFGTEKVNSMKSYFKLD